jgi:tetratricopeptide (TPR) repeat protein
VLSIPGTFFIQLRPLTLQYGAGVATIKTTESISKKADMTKQKTYILVGLLVVILALGGWWLAGRQNRADQAARDQSRYQSLMTTTEKLMDVQNYTEAERQLTDYLKSSSLPKKYQRGAHVRLATIYVNAQKYDQAIAEYKKAEAMDGKPTADVAVGLAYVYEAKDDKQNAIKYFQEAVKLAEKSDDPMADADKKSYQYEIKVLEGKAE